MIGVRLKDERTRLGLTQPALAEAAGAAKRTVIDWEKGVSSPTAAQLEALAQIGLDVLYVVTGLRSAPAVAEPPGNYHLNRREQTLIENYRGSDEQGRRALEGAASAVAHRDGAKKERQGGE